MGAAQYQGVHLLGQHRLEVFLGGHAGDRVFQPAFFHQRHKQGASLGGEVRVRREIVDGASVGIAVDSGGRADDADAIGAGGGQGGQGTGLDDVEYRCR